MLSGVAAAIMHESLIFKTSITRNGSARREQWESTELAVEECTIAKQGFMQRRLTDLLFRAPNYYRGLRTIEESEQRVISCWPIVPNS